MAPKIGNTQPKTPSTRHLLHSIHHPSFPTTTTHTHDCGRRQVGPLQHRPTLKAIVQWWVEGRHNQHGNPTIVHPPDPQGHMLTAAPQCVTDGGGEEANHGAC